jgi:hypothetical protein
LSLKGVHSYFLSDSLKYYPLVKGSFFFEGLRGKLDDKSKKAAIFEKPFKKKLPLLFHMVFK